MAVRCQAPSIKNKLRDSKKLTGKQREEWARYIKNHPRIFYAVARCRPKTIDKINISQAANRAAARALKKLWLMIGGGNVRNVLLDGGLYINNPTSIMEHLDPQTIIKGDEKYNCVKLASIVAKVCRDKFMKKIHKKYPEYGFNRHVGYGTKAHIRAIKKRGPCDLHRLTFLSGLV